MSEELKPCKTCNQTDHGQTGEYPCPECGLPTVWDRKQTYEEQNTQLDQFAVKIDKLEAENIRLRNNLQWIAYATDVDFTKSKNNGIQAIHVHAVESLKGNRDDTDHAFDGKWMSREEFTKLITTLFFSNHTKDCDKAINIFDKLTARVEELEHERSIHIGLDIDCQTRTNQPYFSAYMVNAVKRIAELEADKHDLAEIIADRIVKEAAVNSDNICLRVALADMVKLIDDHGTSLMHAHATKIINARKALGDGK